MQITVRGLHLEITQSIKDYAKKKAEKLDKFFHNIKNVNIELDIHNNAESNINHVASGTVSAAGKFIKAQTVS